MSLEFLAGLCVGLAVLSIVTLIVGILALIEVRAFNKSTHNVQYMPIDPKVDKENEEFMNKLQEDSWATTDESIAKQNKMNKEEIVDNMPEFADSDEKPYSF